MNLYEVYERFDKEIRAEVLKYNSEYESDVEKKLKLPMFLSLDMEEYNAADLKVMIFGQEPLSWSYPNAVEDGGEKNLNHYEDFDSIDDCLNLYKGYMGALEKGFRASTPFNAEYLKLEKELKDIFTPKKVGVLWNNIIKLTPNPFMDYVGLTHYNKIPAIKKASSLIKSELEYFKPNIIIFLSGYKYDGVLKENIEVTSWEDIEGFAQKELCKLNIPNVDLAVRTYHPGYLNREQNLKKRVTEKMTELFSELKENMTK